MVLSDGTIRHLLKEGGITLDPPPEDHRIQPVSVDLVLGNHFRTPDGAAVYTDEYRLMVDQFILGTTRERIVLGGSVVGQVVGKSTLARDGLMVECAGLVDPGFDGQITLELKNLGPSPIPLLAGMDIAQIMFMFTDTPVERRYGEAALGSHYQHQQGATAPRHGWRCTGLLLGGIRCGQPTDTGKQRCASCEKMGA